MKTGIAYLPLHYGRAPSWLFKRMKDLSREIVIFIIDEYDGEELLRRLSDPFWFQAFGCVLGFDWHSSGMTTTVCGALKEGLRDIEKELGFFVAGGKGRSSTKTPLEIEDICHKISIEASSLIYASRIAAKVDSAALQDGYQIYHHTFFFIPSGKWAIVQQGMNKETRYARRYHWLSEGVKDFVCEPHWAICCDQRKEGLNLVALESEDARKAITEIIHENPEFLINEGRKAIELRLPRGHPIPDKPFDIKKMEKAFIQIYERFPQNFEQLLGIKGVGPRTLRALSLISELIYGVKPSFKDPARFSFTHGGKDGHPYPLDRKTYDQSIEILKTALDRARIGDREKMDAIKRLHYFTGSNQRV
ncbi:MAG: DUF763 domain-containing protein [Thermodesulfobacteriota bacterium]